jgi:hypothetical protein
MPASSAELPRGSAACSAPSWARLVRSADRSRGRALLRAMRAVMRSMSAMLRRSLRRSARQASVRAELVEACPSTGSGRTELMGDMPSSAAIASWRACACLRSDSGWCRQWRSQREPMLVAQVSSSDSSVGAGLPARVSLISRLRRVAGSRRRNSLSCSTAIAVTCAKACNCVARAYSSNAPAAPSAGEGCSMPKPARSRVPKCCVSARCADSISKCQSGRRRTAVAWMSRLPLSPSATSTSAGLRRSRWVPSASSVVSSRRRSPLARLSQASPTFGFTTCSASNRLSRAFVEQRWRRSACRG